MSGQIVHLVVVDNDDGSCEVMAAFSDESLASQWADNIKGSVLSLPVQTEIPLRFILYKKRAGMVTAEKFWDFDVEARLNGGWKRTIEEAFEAAT